MKQNSSANRIRRLAICTLMSQESLYDVLLVDQNATLDEIKLAFKRRALQVHPDKGGSKEAFHVVYQALETLADPEARQKYDKGLAKQPAGHTKCRGTERKTSKCGQPQRERCPRQKAGRRNAGTEPAASSESNQTKLLMKIRDLLKKLPRDVRNDVITNQFSQKQRLILEKWMVETVEASASQSGRETEPAMEHPGLPDQSYKLCTLPGLCTSSFSPTTSKKQGSKQKTRNRKNESDAKVPSRSGYVKKKGGGAYTAGICFDGIEMHTRNCDLQSGLEYLVVLTAVKQKMQDSTLGLGITFERRLQEALTSSAKEHGKDLADLKLSFFVLQAAGFFIGSDLRTPSVRTVEQLGRMRHCLQPFRQYAKNVGTRSIYWQHSPAHLKDSWEKFQKAVADAWHMAGVNSTRIQQTIRARHDARLESRNAQLQQWERGHMAMQDKHKYRPRRLRERTETRLQLWERRKMALQDKNEHRPRKFQTRLKLRRCPSESRTQLALKRLLVRWGRILKRQAGMVEKERRNILQQRKVRRKKAIEERKRAEALNREHLRKERLRRENLRKRMRSDFTMADIFGDPDVRQPDRKNRFLQREGVPRVRL